MSGMEVKLVRVRLGKGGTRNMDILAAGGRYDKLGSTFFESVKIGRA